MTVAHREGVPSAPRATDHASIGHDGVCDLTPEQKAILECQERIADLEGFCAVMARWLNRMRCAK